MCKICVDLAKGSMNAADAKRALGEARGSLDEAHIKSIEIDISFAEAQEEFLDDQIDQFLDEYSEIMKKKIQVKPDNDFDDRGSD